jgi:isopentenyl-diphosphate delta-isomerase type 1
MLEEYIDIIDENGRLTGRKVTKRIAHEQGLWHRAVFIWVVSPQGQILVQKRHRDKDYFPGMWDISAAGHVSAGENQYDTAYREAHEELGLVIQPNNLELLSEEKFILEIPERNFYNREVVSAYVHQGDYQLGDFKLQPTEVEEVKWLSLSEAKSMFADSEKWLSHGLFDDLILEYAAKIHSQT